MRRIHRIVVLGMLALIAPVISGCAGTEDPAMSVVVAVYPKNRPPAGMKCQRNLPASNPSPNIPVSLDATGTFHAELTHSLKRGQSVCLWQVSGNHVLGYTPRVVSVSNWTYDEAAAPLGRVRYYLTAGIDLAQDNGHFSDQNLYLGFDLERNWFRGRHWLVNSGFSAQLTSIPAAVTPTSTTSSSSSQTSAATTPPPSASTFIASQKAAVISGDLYFPWYPEHFRWWYHGGHALFLAPLFKGGLQTITSGSLSVTSSAPGTAITTQTLDNQGLYYFWGAGLRLGDLRLFNSWNIAPELLSHLDVTAGQWQNFRQCTSITSSSCSPSPGQSLSDLHQPWLFSLDGRLNIPHTPVQIGFSSITPFTRNGQGDLRFFFGLRLNAGCLFKTLLTTGTASYSDCASDLNGPTGANSASTTATSTAKTGPAATTSASKKSS